MSIHGYVGVSGSGKSFTMKHDLLCELRADSQRKAIVIDLAEEWKPPRFLRRGDVVQVDGARTAGAAAAKLEREGMRLVILRPKRPWTIDGLQSTIQRASTWALERGGVLAIHESHLLIPNGRPLEGELLRLVTTWRHRGAALYWDSQRLALISRTLTAQTGDLRIFTVVDNVDLDVVRKLGPRDHSLEDAVTHASSLFARGEKGWHVKLTYARIPPFKLHRVAGDGYETIDHVLGNHPTTARKTAAQ